MSANDGANSAGAGHSPPVSSICIGSEGDYSPLGKVRIVIDDVDAGFGHVQTAAPWSGNHASARIEQRR